MAHRYARRNSEFRIFAQRSLDVMVLRDVFTPITGCGVVALPPTSCLLQRQNASECEEMFSFRGLDTVIDDTILVSMVESDGLASPAEEEAPPTSVTQEINAQENCSVESIQSPKQKRIKAPPRAPPTTPMLECSEARIRAAILAPRVGARELGWKLEWVVLQRAEGATDISDDNVGGRVFSHSHWLGRTRTIPIEARYVNFTSQREKEGRDFWVRLSGWLRRG
jgi:hypothetical protein